VPKKETATTTNEEEGKAIEESKELLSYTNLDGELI